MVNKGNSPGFWLNRSIWRWTRKQNSTKKKKKYEIDELMMKCNEATTTVVILHFAETFETVLQICDVANAENTAFVFLVWLLWICQKTWTEKQKECHFFLLAAQRSFSCLYLFPFRSFPLRLSVRRSSVVFLPVKKCNSVVLRVRTSTLAFIFKFLRATFGG